MWEKVGNTGSMHFFSGSWSAKLDDKGRFVLPSQLRYGLVENGELSFYLGLGLGGSLAIYKSSDIQKMVERFQKKQHLAKYQPFFTTFFSSLQKCVPDKVGRVSIPPFLKQAVGIKKELVIAGVLTKIEIWAKEAHDQKVSQFISGGNWQKMAEAAFELLGSDETSHIESKEEKKPLSEMESILPL